MSKLYRGKDRKDLQDVIDNLSYMDLSDRQKSIYCNLAHKHLGLSVDMIRFNCSHCGIEKCKVKESVYDFGKALKEIGPIKL